MSRLIELASERENLLRKAAEVVKGIGSGVTPEAAQAMLTALLVGAVVNLAQTIDAQEPEAIQAAKEEEREACAKICADYSRRVLQALGQNRETAAEHHAAEECADRIRARSNP